MGGPSHASGPIGGNQLIDYTFIVVCAQRTVDEGGNSEGPTDGEYGEEGSEPTEHASPHFGGAIESIKNRAKTLDQHRRNDDEAGSEGVEPVKFGPAFCAHTSEGRIVNELDVPSHGRHNHRRQQGCCVEEVGLHPVIMSDSLRVRNRDIYGKLDSWQRLSTAFSFSFR